MGRGRGRSAFAQVGEETLGGSSESFLVEPQGSRSVSAGHPVHFCWHRRDAGFQGVPNKYSWTVSWKI